MIQLDSVLALGSDADPEALQARYLIDGSVHREGQPLVIQQ